MSKQRQYYKGQFTKGQYCLKFEEVPINYRMRAYADGVSVEEMKAMVISSSYVVCDALTIASKRPKNIGDSPNE